MIFGFNLMAAKRCCRILIVTAVCSQVSVSKASDIWNETRYQEDVPTLIEVLGHSSGEKISSPANIVTYLKALNKAVPAQTKLIQYAQSWEGRPLYLLVISAEKNIAELDQQNRNMQSLAEPHNLSDVEKQALLETTLPVSWLSYGVHGDEISSSDAALLLAYHLLAAEGNSDVDATLANSIVVLDPSQNPDGRARFVSHFEQNRGASIAEHPLAAEHRQVWPGGRANHYLFDMNRDWFALTQPETRGKIKQYLQFQPVVHADVHEMGVNQSYYFPPPADPFNPHITEAQKQNLNLYGRGNAHAFDQNDYDYFTREIFDAYYPGYGDTWPALHGAVGMTFEMASARGLAQLREDGVVLTYRDGVYRHAVASLATVVTTATNRTSLLKDFVEYRGGTKNKAINFFLKGTDRQLLSDMGELLSAQGIEVKQLTEAIKVCGESYVTGDLMVSSNQGSGRLVKTLLEPNGQLSDEFWQEKESLRREGKDIGLYDILAWSLPALSNLNAKQCKTSAKRFVDFKPLAVRPKSNETELKLAKLAYLVPWDSIASVKFLTAALQANLKLRVSHDKFTIGEYQYSEGTLLIKVSDNGGAEHLHAALLALLEQHSIKPISLDSSWTDSGINFGSSAMRALNKPSVAMAWGEPTISYSAGNSRFVIEQQLGFPVTPIRTKHLSDLRLDAFDVLVLPEADSYIEVLGADGVANIHRWVSAGGTLITLGAASQILLPEGLAMLDTQLEEKSAETETVTVEEGLRAATNFSSEEEYQSHISSTSGQPDYVPGVLLRAEVTTDSWLTAGLSQPLHFMYQGQDIYSPLKIGTGVNAVRFLESDQLLQGGHLWQENLQQLAYKPAVMSAPLGSGQVVAFTSDPTFRGYMFGLNQLLANAIFFAPR